MPSTAPGASSKPLAGSDALSINEWARRQPTRRLLVEPLLWTKQHLELLSCTFSECRPALPAMMHAPKPDGERSLRKFKSYFLDHVFSRKGESKEAAMRGLIALEPSPLTWFCDLRLFVGGYRSVILPCTYYCLRDDCKKYNPALPMAAHVDRRHITSLRERKLGLPMGFRRNPPALALFDIKIKRLTPTEPLHDPYLVALLIALAQRQWGVLGREGSRQAAGVTPKLLFSSSEDLDYLYLYSANISSTLIDMLDDPATAPSAPNALPIKISSIPYQPLDTLRARLLALLLSATSLDDLDKAENLVVYT